ncbi:DUF4387 family protein [Litoreibacter roseus]|uniref:DUF4387 domain-containing protein n=1 Tax=Litoreibacter roseus TaxID=2601869 RepID=A0A6N6JDR0_9RHOB|nr:DUF4387 family protein [Litoreibacter roseus]GFE64107.1 hypothetical protein KIN_11810 [Litoreibacter roseus]
MTDRVSDIVQKVRSKNAGPFWVTLDLFCGSAPAFERITRGLSDEKIASLLGLESGALKRFELPDLHVLKFSAPRPAVQGIREDRDMHGAGWAVLIAELEID